MLHLDKFQKIRLRRLGMAIGTYSFVIIYAFLIESAGVGELSRDELITLIVGALFGNGLFLLLILSGLNRVLPDPSMTQIQIIFSAGWGMIAILALPDARPLVLMLYLPSFMFGALILKRGAYFKLALLLSVMLGVVQLYEYTHIRPQMNVAYEFLVWACFSVILLWFALFGSYLAKARFLLRRQNITLHNTQERLTRLTEELAHAANTDPLTDILNRRAFYSQVAALETIQRHGRLPHSILLIDVDHFKKLNDQYGHACGDAALVVIAQRIDHLLRANDLLVRWGGEEFLVLLRQVDSQQAFEAAERIRIACERPLQVEDQKNIANSVSIGVAHADDLKQLNATIKAADNALYEAKQNGRNRVVCFDQSTVASTSD